MPDETGSGQLSLHPLCAQLNALAFFRMIYLSLEVDMEVVCLDLEGVLVPEIWIAFSQKTGIAELSRTTRDEPDYNVLMNYRLEILEKNNLRLRDIQDVIASIRPLEGAKDFLDELRSLTQVIILSDTFREFASPLMRQLDWPAIFCNSLTVDSEGRITGFRLRQQDGKRKAVEHLRLMGFRTFAAGDSYNDLSMIMAADSGSLFRAPENILSEYPQLHLSTTYDDFLNTIRSFLDERE